MQHVLIKKILLGTALFAVAAPLLAQSTATQIEEGTLQEVTVSSKRVQSIGGLIQAENSPKSRTTVTHEYLATQPAGQTVIQSLNLVPGVNFTNSDPYGSSGGNLRMRGFDGPRISLMVDGIQLNDSGNYAIYTNQQIDPEILEAATVNLGTTDVDSPTASATGGTINLTTVKPTEKPSVVVQGSGGTDKYWRGFMRADTGAFGPWGTRSFFTFSRQEYDKFKGPGQLQKTQFNASFYQELSGQDFMRLSFHWNRNRNPFYRNLSLADVAANGFGFDNDATCSLPSHAAAGAGIQNDATTATGTTAICTNYYNLRINPSDTGNIRGQSSWALNDKLTLTVDPSFQYTLANGGGVTIVPENDRRLIGTTTAAGVDLNGDGDTLDRVALYSPNTTNTRRYEVNTSLLWTVTESSLLHLAYTLDYAEHRQTGQFGFFDAFGNPQNVFAGRNGTPVVSADGADLRGRDRFSIAKLNQVSLSYSGKLMDDKVHYSLGVRAPYFARQLNQYCYTQSNGSAYCTTQVPSAPNAAGRVTFAGQGTAQFLLPYSGAKKYHDVMPNVGLSYEPWSNGHVFYASYAEGFSSPRTDNLYSVQIIGVQPETTKSYDLGYRYQGATMTGSVALWKSDFENRIVSSFDPDLGVSVDRNVGPVKLYGLDGALGFQVMDGFTLYGTASYNHSKVERDVLFNNAGVIIPTAGKKLVETPDWTYGARAEYKIAGFSVGLQGKYVADRFATDVNDQIAPSYTVFDADARYGFQVWGNETFVQLNAINLTDKQYFGSIATSRFAADTTKPYGLAGPPLYAIGAPRTFQVTVNMTF